MLSSEVGETLAGLGVPWMGIAIEGVFVGWFQNGFVVWVLLIVVDCSVWKIGGLSCLFVW